MPFLHCEMNFICNETYLTYIISRKIDCPNCEIKKNFTGKVTDNKLFLYVNFGEHTRTHNEVVSYLYLFVDSSACSEPLWWLIHTTSHTGVLQDSR